MKFQVTQEDINTAIKGNPHCCPIAKSLSRISKSPIVVYSYSLFNNKCGYTCKTSQEMREFMECFDAGKYVKPTEFEITNPCSCFGE